MPNWCECELTVTCPSDLMEGVLAKMAGPNGALDFDRIVPCPPEVRDTVSGFARTDEGEELTVWREVDGKRVAVDTADLIRRFGHADWYHWNIANWGTKWNAGDPHVASDGAGPRGERRVRIDFRTAWSPPQPLVEALSLACQEAEFDLRYWEGGMGFKGRLKLKAGRELDRMDGTYKGPRGG